MIRRDRFIPDSILLEHLNVDSQFAFLCLVVSIVFYRMIPRSLYSPIFIGLVVLVANSHFHVEYPEKQADHE